MYRCSGDRRRSRRTMVVSPAMVLMENTGLDPVGFRVRQNVMSFLSAQFMRYQLSEGTNKKIE